MCAPNAPAAPDYKGAAEETGKSQKVSQYTPYGSLVYGQDPASPSGYKSTVNLTPDAQSTLDTQMSVSKGLGQAAQQQIPGIQQKYSQPMELGSVQDVADKAYGAQTARLDPMWQQREESQRQNLANQGIGLGSEAYSNAMRDFGQQRNDAYQQANLAAISTMPQTYQLESSTYQQPLNILNALRTGAQIQNPQFGSGGVTDYSKAAGQKGAWDQGMFNSEMGAYNAQLGGAAGLGAATAPYWWPIIAGMSDRRLKSNIVRIGQLPVGVGLYAYDIFGHREIGVMADEVLAVKPEAVMRHPSGYLMVNYGAL